MTSSLVGSEMCIRDRLQPPCPQKLLRPGLHAGGAWLCSRLLDAFLVSVSYTHLTLPTICSV
eukprot:509639-Prorocentrum_lima.AAC.1